MERKYFVEGRWFDDAEKAYSFASVLAFKYCRDIEVQERAKHQHGKGVHMTKLMHGAANLKRYTIAESPTDLGNLSEGIAGYQPTDHDIIESLLVDFEDNLLELHGIE